VQAFRLPGFMSDNAPNRCQDEGSTPMLSPGDRLAALRIIDANFNRATEGLRVVEEYCRFVLADRHLTECCKSLRHELTATVGAIPREQLHVARETQADVGTEVTTSQEENRESLAHVAAASWQRVEQALRAIEEYGKLLAGDLGRRIEQLRYRAYTLAKASVITAESRDRLARARLYVLIDGGRSECEFAERVQELIVAGVHVLQLRDKALDDRTLLSRARLLRRIADESGLPRSGGLLCVVNDRPDIAVLARVDGVHVGQEELTVHDVRQIVGPEMLVGVSTHNIEQARQAVLDGASYLGCGPTFPSGTKQFDHFPGLDFLRQVAHEIALPAFAIGGITLENLPNVLATGLTRVAVGGAIAASDRPRAEAEQFLTRLPRRA
jgi:thiamine-phosphate pyrophosphorylase